MYVSLIVPLFLFFHCVNSKLRTDVLVLNTVSNTLARWNFFEDFVVKKMLNCQDTLFANQSHFLILATNSSTGWNSVIVFGKNSWGQLGTGTRVDSWIPYYLPSNLFGNEEVTDVACGIYSSMALTKSGRFYYWGAFPDRINRYFSVSNTPTIVGTDFRRIFTSKSNQIIALHKNSSLFMWGIGYSDTTYCSLFGNYTESTIRYLASPFLPPFTFPRIFSGWFCTIGIQENGIPGNETIYGWGESEELQFGVNTSTICVNYPTEVKLNISNIKKLLMGFKCALLLDDSGRLFATGRPTYPCKSCGIAPRTLHLLDSFSGIKLSDFEISPLCDRGFGISENSTIWTWGFHKFSNETLSPIYGLHQYNYTGSSVSNSTNQSFLLGTCYEYPDDVEISCSTISLDKTGNLSSLFPCPNIFPNNTIQITPSIISYSDESDDCGNINRTWRRDNTILGHQRISVILSIIFPPSISVPDEVSAQSLTLTGKPTLNCTNLTISSNGSFTDVIISPGKILRNWNLCSDSGAQEISIENVILDGRNITNFTVTTNATLPNGVTTIHDIVLIGNLIFSENSELFVDGNFILSGTINFTKIELSSFTPLTITGCVNISGILILGDFPTDVEILLVNSTCIYGEFKDVIFSQNNTSCHAPVVQRVSSGILLFKISAGCLNPGNSNNTLYEMIGGIVFGVIVLVIIITVVIHIKKKQLYLEFWNKQVKKAYSTTQESSF